MIEFWNTFLYQPLFNGLIWIYNNWTDQSLGWAIIYLTLIVRSITLPFTLINERNKIKNLELMDEIKHIDASYSRDHVTRNEEIRKALKKRKVSPWSKIISLGVQGLVLVLLYQVFVQGITGEKMLQILYPYVDFPGVINTMFLGFDLALPRDILWPGIVAVWLFLEIYFDYRKQKSLLKKADLAYFFLFPFAVFIALWFLPLVKTLFILTSMLFSAIIGQMSKVIFRTPKKPQDKKKAVEAKT